MLKDGGGKTPPFFIGGKGMDINFGSFKTLENVRLKTTQNIEVNGITFEEGETIALFDKIQISGLNEVKDYVVATGGFDNRGLVYWETTKKVNLTFSQGIFSNIQFGLLNNANIISVGQDEPILITTTEELESDENGYVTTLHPIVDQVFVYNKQTGEKLVHHIWNNKIKIAYDYIDVIVNYRYNYMNGASVAKIGQPFLNGFLELEGTTRVKDDTSGLVTTGIIKIPKLKLMSGLSIKLGTQANPVVGTFSAVGVPVEERRSSYVVEIAFLNNDIDSDM